MATYYVKTGGSDSNTGLSDAQAWLTISKVNGITFSPGDNIYFNKGNTFIGRLNIALASSGSAGLPITFGGYGTGANPIIDANATNTRVISINGAYIIIDGIDCKNATTSCGIYTDATATNAIIKNLTVSDIGTTDANIWGIDIRGNDSTVTYCTITDIAGAGIVIGGGGFVYNHIVTYNDITLTNKYYSGEGAGAGIMLTSDNTEIAYNIVHTTGGVGMENWVHGIYAGHDCTNQNIHHNTVSGSLRGSGIKLAGSGSVHHNYITTSYDGAIQLGGNYPGTINVTQNVYNNIATGNRNGIWENNQGTGTLTLNIYNNTFYLNNNTARDIYNSEIEIDDAINTSLIIKNNILVPPATRWAYAIAVPQSYATINNNCIYKASGDPISYDGFSRTWVAWQGYGYDTQGVNSNPLVVSASDFHLQVGSPCINAGIDVGLTTDYEGQVITGNPDIGAYEYGSYSVLVGNARSAQWSTI